VIDWRLGEALALVGQGRLGSAPISDFLTSTLFVAPVYKTYGGLIADKKFETCRVAAPLGFKDNRLVRPQPKRCVVPMPLASLIYKPVPDLAGSCGESLDWSPSRAGRRGCRAGSPNCARVLRKGGECGGRRPLTSRWHSVHSG